MKIKKKKEESTAKTEMLTMRCSGDIIEFIDAVRDHLNAERPLGVSKITRTDATLTLLNYGVKHFIKNYGDPRIKQSA